jgi:hypothetical protein
MAYSVDFPSRSRKSRFPGRRIIATVNLHFEHKSCAVKFHAYTLDNSCDLASAVQQEWLFPQLSGITLFSLAGHDKACARPSFHHQQIESYG